MGSGTEKRHMNFHLHLPHHRMKVIPKGCIAVMVGHEGEEKLERFVVPIIYINHPLFVRLLKEAEEEYGFDQKGPITIPCHVEEFLDIQGMIDREHHNPHQQHHHHHEHHHHFLCFKA